MSNTTLDFNFTGQGAKAATSGYPPRSIFTGPVTKIEVGMTQGNQPEPKATFYITADQVYTPNDDGTYSLDESLTGTEYRFDLKGANANISEKGNNAREAEIKAALLASGVYNQHAAQAGKSADAYLRELKGGFQFQPGWLQNVRLYGTFDPPPPGFVDASGQRGYPQLTLITGKPTGGPEAAGAEYTKIVSGSKKISWYYDGKTSQAQSQGAMGAAAAMLPGGAAPAVGLPPGLPGGAAPSVGAAPVPGVPGPVGIPGGAPAPAPAGVGVPAPAQTAAPLPNGVPAPAPIPAGGSFAPPPAVA